MFITVQYSTVDCSDVQYRTISHYVVQKLYQRQYLVQHGTTTAVLNNTATNYPLANQFAE